MRQTGIEIRKTSVSRHKRGRKKRWTRLLFASVFIMAAVLTLTGFAPARENRASAKDNAVIILTAARPQASWQPVARDSWKLTLVNPWNPVPEDYSVETVTLKNGLKVDRRCYPDLQDMMDDCRADGLSPVICSAYRTQEDQERLFRNKVSRLINQGYSEAGAAAEAGKSVAVPGTSEHQLGLAVDIVDINNQLLDETQESTEVQKWLMEHSWEYGFILRYPNDKSEITGIIYEPWHYRYVGREDAEQIHALGVCLEEYLHFNET